MCLNIKKQFDSVEEVTDFMRKPNIATEDIVVYKVLEDNYDGSKTISPYRDVEYEIGELKTAPEFGYSCENATNDDRDKIVIALFIDRGIHSYKTIESAKIGTLDMFTQCFAVKSIIPKGTPYFENDGEYVSLALQMPNKFERIK